LAQGWRPSIKPICRAFASEVAGGCEILVAVMTETERQFLDYSSKKLQELSSRIDTCLLQLNDELVWARGGDNENALGNMVLHLCGNVRQWILSGIGGEPDTRRRDEEFAARGGVTVPELRDRLNATISAAIAIIDSVPSERLTERHSIQGYDASVLEVIYHVLEHFSMHTGQVIFVTKMLTGADLGFYRHLQSSARPASR
jgi:uncharacterized damage-inducible protein DinB